MKTFFSLSFWIFAGLVWGQTPRLVVPVAHIESIKSVVFSSDGKYILTGSDDKTAKLWTIDGQEVRTFSGHSDAVNAVAFSPDGRQVLTGSGDNTAKLWTLDGQEVRSFTGHSQAVFAVAFSPDGRQVLTGSGDKTAKLWTLDGHKVRRFAGHKGSVWSVAFSPDGRQVLTGSDDYTAKLWTLDGQEVRTFTGHSEGVGSVAFSPDGRQVLTGSLDNKAKLWTLDGQEVHTFSDGFSVFGVAFSPDGRYVLTGGGDKTAKLWTLDGHKVRTFAGHSNQVWSVAFSPDGRQLLTGGSDDNTAKLWTIDGLEVHTFYGHSRSVSAVAFSPDGRQLLTGSWDNTVKLWTLDGQEVSTFTGHSEGVRSMAFSPDGRQMLTGSGDNTAKLWTLDGWQVRTFAGHSDDVTAVAFSPDGRQVLTGSWDNTAKLWTLDGHKLRRFAGHSDGISAVAFSPDGRQVLTGSWDKTAKLWTLDGRELYTFSGHSDAVRSVAFSPDGQRVLTISSDHTAKLWSPASGQELATFIPIDVSDWVVTTPSGLFDASPGAMKFMHYVKGLEVIELNQLKERYYEPGLLAKIMGFDQGELRNVAAFDQVALYPEIKANIENDRLSIRLTERNGGMGKLSLFLNDKEIQEDINPNRQKSLSLDLNIFAKYYRSDTTNTLALRAYNAEGWLKSQAYELAYTPAKTRRNEKPSLYVLAVGASDYAGEQLDLRFADLDAEALAKAFQSAGGALFTPERTSVRLLSSHAKTPADVSAKTNIRQAFADIAAKAKPEDVVIVFFSGHGLAYGPAEKEQFYYLTKDIGSAKLDDPKVRQEYTVSSEELTQWLNAIPAGKQVMIVDACNAGKVVESLSALAAKDLDPSQIRALDRMKDRTGMFILTGSAADKVSYEATQYGQGLLTYSLLQGMNGLAISPDRRVDVMTLFQYARDRVPELARGIGGVQTPVLAFPTGGASFDIGIAKPGAISVAQEKPVFIRSIFLDENFGDDLKLVKALEDYFQEITLKGAQAELIYSPVSEFDAGYSIRGNYAYQGETVVVKGSLLKGNTPLGKFQVNGKKSNVPDLVAGILEEVSGMIK